MKKRVYQLAHRIEACATHQEGTEPNEDPTAIFAEMDAAIARFEELVCAVNIKNSQTVVDGRTLTEWIARKDCLKLKIDQYLSVVGAASRWNYRTMKTEIRILASVDVKALNRRIDELSKELRTVDNLIQKTNWEIEL